MTTKHTPGPWTSIENGQVIAHARPPAWRTLADVYGAHGDEEQANVDARLMAAAPDLLAALEAMVRSDSWADADVKMIAARAAIAKAKGKP